MATIMCKDKETKVSLKSARLYGDNGNYYLNLRYLVENGCNVTEWHIPKVELPLADLYSNMHLNSNEEAYLVLPDRELRVLKSFASFQEDGETRYISDVFFACKVIEEKAKDMTIEEIEKKLGHKVRIVDSH